MVITDSKQHWNKVYASNNTEQLGWYQENPEPSLKLISKCQLFPDSSILIAGAGTTTLADNLLSKGFENLTLTDISNVALEKLKDRLGKKHKKELAWIEDDLSNPNKLNDIKPVSCWHDRAVLHFFTGIEERKTYFDLLRKLVKPGGFVIIAAFHLDGAPKCSGLPVYRYDETMLAANLGKGFRLLESFLYDYTMPSGDTRPYVYTLFQKEY